jgi:hypothetical protein
MRLATLKCAAVLIGVALIGGSAQAATKPGPGLANNQCHAVWKMASPNGETLSRDDVTPYVLNFAMVDSDHNGKITSKEFRRGCKSGWITAADASTIKSMRK